MTRLPCQSDFSPDNDRPVLYFSVQTEDGDILRDGFSTEAQAERYCANAVKRMREPLIVYAHYDGAENPESISYCWIDTDTGDLYWEAMR